MHLVLSAHLLSSALVLLLHPDGGGGVPTPKGCEDVPIDCGSELVECFSDAGCVVIMTCMTNCGEDDAECAFTCGMVGLANQPFLDISQCMADSGCMPDYPDDGVCLAEDSQALQDITDLNQVSGDWWVVKGQNCGQEGWPGGYDWYPCQHGRFLEEEDGSWINNTTYCAGSDSVCTSPILVTTPDIYLTAPGVVRHDYPEGEAPVLPQIEDWKFISYPHPDWAFVAWCGSNPALNYNGAFVITRERSLAPLEELPEVEQELRAAVESLGLDWDAMCETDNTDCPV